MRNHLVHGFIDDTSAHTWDVFDGRDNDGETAKFVLSAVVPDDLTHAELSELAIDYFREDITSDHDCTGEWFSRSIGVIMGSTFADMRRNDDGSTSYLREIFVSVNYGRDI